MAKTDLVPCFYKEQDDTWEIPARILLRAEVREMKIKAVGKFENNGRTFRLFKCRPVVQTVYHDDSPSSKKENDISSDACISFGEMQANVGIVREGVKNERGMVQLAQAKVRWYQRVRSYPELACGRWASVSAIQVSA